jgi:hypothetical protein
LTPKLKNTSFSKKNSEKFLKKIQRLAFEWLTTKYSEKTSHFLEISGKIKGNFRLSMLLAVLG